MICYTVSGSEERRLRLNIVRAGKAHTMVRAKKTLHAGMPRIQLNPYLTHFTPGEPSLLVERLKELDREFARQSKQLAKLTKDLLTKKLTKKP